MNTNERAYCDSCEFNTNDENEMKNHKISKRKVALSIKQPFASFIIDGLKGREHRTWNTNFRGEFYIHASKVPDKSFIKEWGFNDWKFQTGCILGKAELYDVEDYGNGTYAWLLRNIVKFENPIPYKGQLSFFEVTIGESK